MAGFPPPKCSLLLDCRPVAEASVPRRPLVVTGLRHTEVPATGIATLDVKGTHGMPGRPLPEGVFNPRSAAPLFRHHGRQRNVGDAPRAGDG
jgi:hypothetical protein